MKKNYTYLLFIIAVLLGKTNTAKAQVNVSDSFALVDLYNSTDGPHWRNHTNWLTRVPVSNWFGIQLKDNRVSYIFLNSNKLKGKQCTKANANFKIE